MHEIHSMLVPAYGASFIQKEEIEVKAGFSARMVLLFVHGEPELLS